MNGKMKLYYFGIMMFQLEVAITPKRETVG